MALDPETSRAIGEIVQEIRELTMVMRGLGRTMSAIGDNEIKALGKNVGSASGSVKELGETARGTGKLLDQYGQEIQAATEATEKDTEATEESARSKQRLTREEFVYRRAQRSAFRDLTEEFSSTRGATARLQEGLFGTMQGNEALQGAVLMTEALFRGLGKATMTLTRDIYAGQRGAAVTARAFSDLAKEVGTAAQGVGLALGAFSLLGIFVPKLKLFGIAVGAVRGALAALAGAFALFGIGLKTAAELNEIAAKQNDDLFRSFNELSAAGAGFAGGLDGLFDTLQQAGMSVAEIQAFTTQIAANTQKLAFLGVTTGEAARNFARVSGDLRKSGLGKQLEMLGIQAEEQRELAMGYMTQQMRLGRLENRSTQELIQSSARYARELDQLAQLTGTSRKAQQEAREALMADERLRSAMVSARLRGDQEELNRLTEARDLAALVKPFSEQLATGIVQIAAGKGALTTDAATAAEMSAGVSQVLNSQGDLAAKFSMLTRNLEQSQQFGLPEVSALIGTIPGYQIPVVEQDDLVLLGKKIENLNPEELGKFLEQQQRERARGDKALGQNVEAGRLQQNAAMIMDSVVNTFSPATTVMKTASETFEAAVKQFAQTVGARPVAGGLMDGGRALAGRSSQNRAFAAGRGQVQGSGEDYLSRIAELESGGRNIGNIPRAGQQATSAFGLYQITEPTFKGLVANAPPDSALRGKTFEDMKADVTLQTEAMKQLTSSNEQMLARRGLSTSDAAKYMAHMMGYPTAARILEASAGAPSSRLVPSDWLEKNNLQHLETAGDLRKHFDQITGAKGYRAGGISRGPESGYLKLLHGTEAVVPLPDGKNIPVAMSGPVDRFMSRLAEIETPTPAARPAPTEPRGTDTTPRQQIDMMSAQLSRLDEVVAVMRSQLGVSQRILQVSQN